MMWNQIPYSVEPNKSFVMLKRYNVALCECIMPSRMRGRRATRAANPLSHNKGLFFYGFMPARQLEGEA